MHFMPVTMDINLNDLPENRCLVIHPLNDVPQEKIDTSNLGPMAMTPSVKISPLSGQINFIFQTHPAFDAKYSGPNSLQPDYEKATSRVMTLYTGYRFNGSTETLVDIEEAGGQGLSTALGVAGFPNLDVVRNPTLSQSPYIARAMFHGVLALSQDRIEADPGLLSTFSELPVHRLEVRIGPASRSA